MDTKEKKRVMEAFINGEEIEILGLNYLEWVPILKDSNPIWNWQDYNYRIKPKTKKVLKTLADYPIGRLIVWDTDTERWIVPTRYRSDGLFLQGYWFTFEEIEKKGRKQGYWITFEEIEKKGWKIADINDASQFLDFYKEV